MPHRTTRPHRDRALPSLRPSSSLSGIALSAALLGSACTGTFDSGPSLAPGVSPPGTTICDTPSPPSTPLRHLGRVEIDYSLQDLLHVDTTPALTFAADDSTIGFEVGSTVSDRLARQYLDAGESLAAAAVTDLAALDPILERCTASGDPTGTAADTCARDFIRAFGRRAFRRPLETAELDEYATLFDTGRDLETFSTGIQLVVNAMIVSPNFLYHAETVPPSAAPGDVIPVTGYEMASRLSFFFWRSGPDDALLDAAEAGELDDATGIEMHAREMLEDERATRGQHELFRQWLGLSTLDAMTKNTEVYPEWTPELRGSLRSSIYGFLDDVMSPDDGSLSTLMTGNFTYADARLASVLELPAPSGTGSVRVSLPATERAGLLTQPAMMAILGKANQSDPIHRGVFVRTRILCGVLQAPPDDVDLTPPDLDPGLTTRQRFDMHRTETRCAACHTLIDPIGYGFEHYDAIGRFRAEENGIDVDARGEVIDGQDASGTFDGAIELSETLLASDQFQGCVARQFFRFAEGRIETRDDACSTASLEAVLRESDGNMRELMIGIAGTDAFLHRRIAEGSAP
jgi:hypothetical protein